jgi:hypothetical protein
MGWAARTQHKGPGMHNTRTGYARRSKVWSQQDMARALNDAFKLGQPVKRREPGELLHKPSGHGKGKWHSVRTLRAYKAASKVARQVAAASRAINRAA